MTARPSPLTGLGVMLIYRSGELKDKRPEARMTPVKANARSGQESLRNRQYAACPLGRQHLARDLDKGFVQKLQFRTGLTAA
jgi:hypothetical protein